MTPAFARRLFAIMAIAAGLGVLATTAAFQFLPEVKDAAACARSTSLIEFQQARSMDDLIAVFSAPGGRCRAPMVAAMDAQNTLDLVLYIPLYALFLVAAAAAFERRVKSPLFLMAFAAAAIGVAGDVLETLIQLRIADDVEAARPLLAPLAVGYWLKYAGLAAHAAVFAGIAFRAGRRFWLLALAAIAPPLAFAAAAAGAGSSLIAAFAVFWLALLAALALLAFRPADAPATDRPPSAQDA
ncbi:MAG: hypothetical protein HXY28_13040 [Hydrogenophilaceae bacterium]|nr:hypothetical protein [Hydrogenophilaceae bacterium]